MSQNSPEKNCGTCPVMLQAMHPEALNSEEEWAGVSSQQLRRKLQNRLNQRGHRRRKALAEPREKDQGEPSQAFSEPQNGPLGEAGPQSQTQIARRWSEQKPFDRMLGQGRIDPFCNFPVQRVPLYVHEILDHALTFTWPGVCPAQLPPGKNPVNRAWLQCAMNSPMAFHGFVFAAALHHNHLHGGQTPDRKSGLLQLTYQTQAIKLINAMLRRTAAENIPPSDALLVSILILAAHGPRQTLSQPLPPAHPQSPLARAQNLDFYGSLSFVPTHLGALHILVEQKGGLGTVELYGLADTLAFGELVGHSLSQSPPKFPRRWEIPPSITVEPHHTVQRTFNFASAAPSPHIVDLLDAIAQARAITNALTRYNLDFQNAPPWLDIIHARNAAQHRFLSLPAFDGLVGRDDAIYNAVRLSVLIYSEIVIFPFPDVAGVKPKLAATLRRALDCCTLYRSWEGSSRLMLWVSTLGAIAASYTPDRAWYVAKCKMCLDMLEIEDSSRFLKTVRRFLWWDFVCEKPAMTLWDEARPAEIALRSKKMLVNDSP